MNKQTRYSFAKNNMNAAIAMRTNACGQTVLGDSEPGRGEHIEVNDVSQVQDAEFQPHIGPSGEFVHNQSVINSPALRNFIENYVKNTEKSESTEIPPEQEQSSITMLNGEFASVTDIDAYAKEFHDAEVDKSEPSIAQPEPVKPKRAFLSHSLIRFCTECGFAFNSEKFCPHCGRKRATYSAPNA